MKADPAADVPRYGPWEFLWYSPGAGARALAMLLAPLSVLFGAAVRIRAALYDRGLLKVGRAPAPVVSVGGLRVGGAGKTPLVLWLVRRLVEEGIRPCIVTRGYGRAGAAAASQAGQSSAGNQETGEPFLLQGEAIESQTAVARAGDEAVLLARRTGAPVVVGADRIAACALAEQRLGAAPDVYVLDDGFQHRRLARDLDLVLVNGRESGERLLPAGPLREGTSALGRAQVVLELVEGSQAGRAGPDRADRLQASLRPTLLISRVSDAQGEAPSWLAGRKVVAVAAIARPERFLADLRVTGAQVVATVLRRDHHRFDESDRRLIDAEAARADLVVTTEKDLVKLEHLGLAAPLRALRIDLCFEDPAAEGALLARVRSAFDR